MGDIHVSEINHHFYFYIWGYKEGDQSVKCYQIIQKAVIKLNRKSFDQCVSLAHIWQTSEWELSRSEQPNNNLEMDRLTQVTGGICLQQNCSVISIEQIQKGKSQDWNLIFIQFNS
jgi:hypothetical protein